MATIAILSACGSSGDGGPVVPPPTPAISIALSAPTLDVTQGAAGPITVTLTRSGGYTGAVTVAAEGLPANVTAPNVTIASGETSGQLTFTAAASAAAATSPITVRATGTGVTAVTSPLSLAVKAAPAPSAGGFTISLSPTTVSLAQGASQNVTATIARSGTFAGPVALSVTGMPAGLTATVTPASVTGTTATIALSASATAAAGAANLSVAGTGTGVANQAVSLGVTVTATTTPTPGTGSLTWKFCGSSGIPVWVATQDGTAAWTRVTGTADSYSFNVASGKGGIAYVVPTTSGFDMQLFFGTAAELQARGGEMCGGPVGPGKSVSGSVAGAGVTDVVLATLGQSLGVKNGTALAWTGVPNTLVDLIASRQAVTIAGTSVGLTLDKMIIRRGLNPAAGSTLPVLDFGGAEAFNPVARNVTIGNLGTDQSIVVGTYVTANGTVAAYQTDIGGGTAATRGWKGVPAANQAAGDFHFLNVTALQPVTQTLNHTRNAGIVFKDAVDKTVALGPVLSTPTVSTPATAPYVRPRSVLPVQAEYNRFFTADYQQGGAQSRRTQVLQTAGYAAGATVTLDVPDLSAVAGFDANWGLKVGTVATWTLAATGWTGAGGIVSTPFVEGGTYLSATRMGQFTP